MQIDTFDSAIDARTSRSSCDFGIVPHRHFILFQGHAMVFRCLVGALALVVCTTAVDAADLATETASPALAYSWSGVYVGGQIGYEFGRERITAGNVFPALSFSPAGVVGGAHLGYLHQFGQIVLGLELDGDGSSKSGHVFNAANGATLGSSTRADAALLARVGFAVDRTLFYVTGGSAAVTVRDSYIRLPHGNVLESTHDGWTAGAGVEYAVTGQWRVRAEYRYSDYGTFDEMPGTVTVPRDHHDTDQRVQTGLSYVFGDFTPLPVVATY